MKTKKILLPAALLFILASANCSGHQCDAFTAQDYEVENEKDVKTEQTVAPEDV